MLLAFAAFSGIYAAVYLLYHEPLEPVLYAGLLTAALGAGIGVTDFLKYRRRHMALRCQIEAAGVTLDRLPEAGDLLERDYQELAAALSQRNAALVSEADSRLSERMDYYTLWTHQIKTPIAAMRRCSRRRRRAPASWSRSCSRSSSTPTWRCSISGWRA